MKTYKEWSPSQFDCRGLGLDDRQDWLVAPVIITRDSGILEQSNWEVVKKDLQTCHLDMKPDYDNRAEEGQRESDVEVHRFSHWGPGWFEIILIRPYSQAAEKADEWEGCLSDYPVACDSHYSNLEREECQRVWKDCYTTEKRIEMIRDNRKRFEFHDLTQMMACVRGKLYRGESDLILDG